jgi:hypothetical protein
VKISNKLTEKHIGHDITTKRAEPKSPHYGYYHCNTCNKFVSWIPKEIYYAEKNSQKREDVMWFGKYQGTKLSDLPQNYLEWAIKNVDKGVKKLIEEYERRQHDQAIYH